MYTTNYHAFKFYKLIQLHTFFTNLLLELVLWNELSLNLNMTYIYLIGTLWKLRQKFILAGLWTSTYRANLLAKVCLFIECSTTFLLNTVLKIARDTDTILNEDQEVE